MKLRCLIIDDEPIARQILEKYCALLPEMEVLRCCGNALEAKQIIQTRPVDLAFLKTLPHPPLVVFTTAYKEFAHQAFDLAACDYLLKPFSLERFIVAVDKAKEKLLTKGNTAPEPSLETHTYIKSEGRIYKIKFDEVLYAEADGNNVKIVTDKGQVRPVVTFHHMEELLPKSKFIRLHRSFIINKSKITHIEGNRVFIGSTEIPIGSNYRELFFRELGIR